MADTADPKDLQAFQKTLAKITSTLQDFDAKSRTIFEQNLPSHIRRGGKAFEDMLKDSEKAMQGRLNSLSTKLTASLTGMSKESAAAFTDMAGDHAAAYTKSLMSSIRSGLSFGLPGALGPLALVAGPINQLTVVQAENLKTAASWGAAYGNILPGQIKATSEKLGNVSLQVVQMSNKYRQSKEDILATSIALARNTVVQQEGIMTTTKTIAQLSRLHDIPMAELTEQMVTATKQLNVEASKTPEIYGDIAAYANEAGIGTQFLLKTSLDLAVGLARQGSNFQDFAGFIATATTNLEKLGMSERVATEGARGALSGLAGMGEGESMLTGKLMMRNVQSLIAGGKESQISKATQDAIRIVAASALPAGKQDIDFRTAATMVSRDPLLQMRLRETAGGTDMWRDASNEMVRRLNPRGGSLDYLVAQGFQGARTLPEYMALKTTSPGFAAGQKGMTGEERSVAKDPGKVAEELGRQQMSAWEKMTRLVDEIKTNTAVLKVLVGAGSVLAGGQILSQGLNMKRTFAQQRGMYRDFETGSIAMGPNGYEYVPPGAAGPGGVAGGAQGGFRGMSAPLRGVSKLALGGSVVGGLVAGTVTATSITANTSTTNAAMSGLGAIGGSAAMGAQFAGPIGAAIGAAAASVPLIAKALWASVELVNEKRKGIDTEVAWNMQEHTRSETISKKYGFDLSLMKPEQKGQFAMVYDSIQSSINTHHTVDLKKIAASFDMTEKQVQAIVDIINKNAKDTPGGKDVIVDTNGTTGRTTIITSDPGTSQANLNNGNGNSPRGVVLDGRVHMP